MNYPILLYFCALLLGGLLLEAFLKLNEPWSMPAIGVYITVLAWYFVDPFQSPDAYKDFSNEIIEWSYIQVAMFSVAFRVAVPRITARFSRKLDLGKLLPRSPGPEKLFVFLMLLWIPLFLFAVSRMRWNFFAALFPLDGRAGDYMWIRGALGEGIDAFVSAGSYIYQLVCGLFGVTLVLQRHILLRITNAVLLLLSIPHFLLSGTRRLFLAVITPLFLTYFLMHRSKLWLRLTVVGVSFALIFSVLLTVIENRNTGFRYLVDEEAAKDKEIAETEETAAGGLGREQRKRTHEGLNMIQELCFINEFHNTGIFQPDWGRSFLVQLANFIPRALWPNKPMIGIDYAVWRGFSDTTKNIGVAATIATGMIGSGIMNFGIWFGPPAAGLILAAWAALLARWWQQRQSILRLCLFMAGLGLTFNLGRDIARLLQRRRAGVPPPGQRVAAGVGHGPRRRQRPCRQRA